MDKQFNKADASTTVPVHYPQISDDGIPIMPSNRDDKEDSIYDDAVDLREKEKMAWPEAAEKKHRKLND